MLLSGLNEIEFRTNRLHTHRPASTIRWKQNENAPIETTEAAVQVVNCHVTGSTGNASVLRSYFYRIHFHFLASPEQNVVKRLSGSYIVRGSSVVLYVEVGRRELFRWLDLVATDFLACSHKFLCLHTLSILTPPTPSIQTTRTMQQLRWLFGHMTITDYNLGHIMLHSHRLHSTPNSNEQSNCDQDAR